MARFDYLEPHTLRQALSMLQQYGDQARIVAGCTDFLVRWRTGVWNPQYVINLSHVPGLDSISYSTRNGLRLGPLVTVQTLERHPAVREHYPALASGATSFAGVQIRNLATVGGNVCNASPAGDILPALLAFETQCKIVGPEGEHWVALDKFFKGPGITAVQCGEILTEFRLPRPARNSGSLYIKHSPRGSMDISAVGVASVVSLRDRGRVCDNVKITLGAVAPTPIRAYGAEELLRGQTITPELIQVVAQEAQNIAKPIDDVRATGAYRKAVVRALVQRTLEKSIEMAQGTEIPFEVQRRLAIQIAF